MLESNRFTAITKTCKECSEPFELSPQDQQWFESKELHQPTRCKPCRQQRKQEAQDIAERRNRVITEIWKDRDRETEMVAAALSVGRKK
jgi:hypothetical protein